MNVFLSILPLLLLLVVLIAFSIRWRPGRRPVPPPRGKFISEFKMAIRPEYTTFTNAYFFKLPADPKADRLPHAR